MLTAIQYMESIEKMKYNAYLLGNKLDCPAKHPMIRPSLEAVAMTYGVAEQDEYKSLATARSHIDGQIINRFTHIHQSTEDLVKKVKLQRVLGQQTGTCFQRCVGFDAMNALASVSYECDLARGTNYHQRVLDFVHFVQENDLVCDGAMTDPKGDRGKRPTQQADRDLFLHVVEQRKDGIVVKGAKCHQTGALNSHQIIVMPTMSLRQGEEEYAVSFAVPSDSAGITYIVGRQASDSRKMENVPMDVGNSRFGGHECLVIFDEVFVPWERVFMYRETEFAGKLVERFAGFHRQSYGGCKVGVGDVLIGAVAELVDMQGISNASHAKDKLVEMIHLNETLYACGLACSTEGSATPSGAYVINMLLANVCKLNVTRFPYEISRLADDLAGGLMVTMPSQADLMNPETGRYMLKYLAGVEGIDTESRLRMLRLVENLTNGSAAVAYRTESMHGAGPPQAMRVTIARQSDLEEKKGFARKLAGVAYK